MIFTPQKSQAQCACVWLDASGIKQCVLYPNCSSGFLSACANQSNGGNFLCLSGAECQVYPGSTPGCVPLCLSNGACWYNGNKCVATSICPTVLPIGLIELKGVGTEESNLITWKTVFEDKNEYFVVERSTDLENWTKVVQLDGAGSSTDVLGYSIEDREPKAVINYYKIVQVDYDGTAVEYGPISIDNREEPRVLLKTVDVLGKEVDEYYQGFVFNCYSDGTTEKILQ